MGQPSIVIAGASGYVGRVLIPKLLAKFPDAQIVALSRSQQVSDDSRVVWRACDLFSIESIEQSIPRTLDLAVYLVHSMGPTAQLDQGNFADYDLLLADNFSRAVQATGLKQLIYLGGLIPDSPKLSLHLQSRLEVEETFAQYQLPVTVFRAGLIIGESGSSAQILLKLVTRLPIMICPQWTRTLTTPIDLDSALSAIALAALNEEHIGRTFDLAGCQPITYIQMMRETAKRMGKRRYFVTVPFFTPTLSRLWVSLVTNTPKNLVYPLIESLEHPMVARATHLFSAPWCERSYYSLIENSVLKLQPGRSLFRSSVQRNTVRSVQRLALPLGSNAEWVKAKYVEWLPRFLAPLVKVSTHGPNIFFSVFSKKLVMLELQLSAARSHGDQQLLHIKSGLLVANTNQGRLEFRVVLNRRYILAAIHDYRPALPWFIYKYTQAQIHLLVMNAFGRYLARSKGAE
jgi:uncharacterized protein YbjT (DUF2867 family)